MKLLKGTDILKDIKLKINKQLTSINPIDRPGLAMIINEDNYGAVQYAHQLQKDCNDVGIGWFSAKISSKTDPEFIYRMIDDFNTNNDITAILVQCPLPDRFKDIEKDVINMVDDNKLIDRPFWKMNLDNERTWPGTPYGIYLLLNYYNIDLARKRVNVIGRSKTVGMPLSMILTSKDATVSICHSKSGVNTVREYCENVDIIISAAGCPNLINHTFNLNKSQIVIDVGCNVSNGKLCGDVDYDYASKIVKAITPVPGGVGPMTRAAILTQIMTNL